MALMGTDPSTVSDSDESANEQAALIAFALMGYQEAFDELNKDLPEEAQFKDGFQAGKKLALECKATITKIGKDFTKHIWSPIADD
jgi:hypothetical protein